MPTPANAGSRTSSPQKTVRVTKTWGQIMANQNKLHAARILASMSKK